MNPNPRKYRSDRLTIHKTDNGMWVVKDPRRWGLHKCRSFEQARQKAVWILSV